MEAAGTGAPGARRPLGAPGRGRTGPAPPPPPVPAAAADPVPPGREDMSRSPAHTQRDGGDEDATEGAIHRPRHGRTPSLRLDVDRAMDLCTLKSRLTA